MRRHRGVLVGLGLLVLAGCGPAKTAGTSATPGTPAAAAPAEATPATALADWEGEYSFTHPNGMVEGDTFDSTDRLRILALDDASAYFEAELFFFNGHMCSLNGVAKASGGDLTYLAAPDSIYSGCDMTFRREGGQLKFISKDNSCEMTSCGVRGSYQDYAMPLASRTPLADVDALRQTDMFRDAMKEAGR